MGCNCDNCGGKVIGLAHIGIMVKDAEVSKKFYMDVLDFELKAEYKLGDMTLVFIDRGDCKIELVAKPTNEARLPGTVDHICLEVEDIEPLMCRLIEKGVKFDTDNYGYMPDMFGGVRNVFFKGPDGERIEFFDYMKK